MIDQLRSELWLLVPESRQPGSAMVALSPLELISVRGKYPDLSSLAGIKMARIQRITLGGAPEFVEVGHKYVLFFEGVARGSWGLVLRQRLRRADEALKELSRKTLARKAYLDEFEKTLGGDHQNGLKAVDPAVIPGLEKSRIESYLDEAEKRFDKP